MRPPAYTAPTRALRTLLTGALVLTAALGATLLPGTAAPAHAAEFTVYTNERAVGQPDLAQYGAVRATVAYDAFHFTCDADGCYANGGALPDQATFENDIRTYVGEFGGDSTAPIVLDYENIVVTALSGQAATNAFDLWKNELIPWTHDAEPGAPVGMYGYDWQTANNTLTQQLHQDGLFDFFAPRAYTGSTQTAANWTSTLKSSVANDQALAPGQPVYPYLSPQFTDTGASMSGTLLASEISQVQALTTGAVMWEPSAAAAADCPWIEQFAYTMGQLTGTGSSGPLSVTATVPNTCVVTRGGTTSVPVTVTNNGTATSAATVMRPVAGPQGITESYTYYDVPALAPGGTWTTTLSITVPAAQTDGSALLEIDYGTGFQRLTVIAA
ncbi:COG1470 family protein [Actinacidiphila sp. bgisy144]|uniref:COG1470 family protein n=1 Tax=Actinacidiphila sp. bgisy144 TaxID=3413791 RepID=UPI003EBBB7AE